MKKIFLSILVAILLIGGVTLGAWWLRNLRTDKFANDQIKLIQQSNYADVYSKMSEEVRAIYDNAESFNKTMTEQVRVDPDSSIRYVGKVGDVRLSTYYYQITRKNDTSTGYEVSMEISGLLNNEIQDFTIQEVNFLKN